MSDGTHSGCAVNKDEEERVGDGVRRLGQRRERRNFMFDGAPRRMTLL